MSSDRGNLDSFPASDRVTLLREAIEYAPTAMVMTDRRGRIFMVNQEAERLFGYQREELFGKSVEVLIPRRSRESHKRHREEFAATGGSRRIGAGRDLLALRKDGTELQVEIGLNTIETEEGLFVLSSVTDISDRKRLEAELRKANELLEARVGERTAELAAQTEELRRSNEALERSNMELQHFAYVASHDLQSPLRSISGFAQLLQEQYQNQLDAQAEDWIRRAVGSIQQMQALIRDLLAYSSVDARTRPFEETDFQEVFDDAVKALNASIQDSGAMVTCDSLPVVLGDRWQLVQLMQNLLANALIYRRNNHPSAVHVSAVRQGTEWVFSVRDDGIGIDPKYHERVFEIFRRLHDQQEYPGTGIGLAICRRVVQGHGGRIWLESEPGRGSIFYFSIPERMVSES